MSTLLVIYSCSKLVRKWWMKKYPVKHVSLHFSVIILLNESFSQSSVLNDHAIYIELLCVLRVVNRFFCAIITFFVIVTSLRRSSSVQYVMYSMTVSL